MMKIDISGAIRELRRAHQGLRASTFDAAVAAALNHTIAKAKTGAARQIRTVYKIKQKDLSGKNGSLTTIRANPKKKIAVLLAMGRPIPVFKFGARKRKDGVSVNIMGSRKVIKGAFFATMKSGHKGVWGRGEYIRGDFAWRKKRQRKRGNDVPIEEIKTVSAPTALMNQIVLQVLDKRMRTDFKSRLAHELARRSPAL